MRQSKYIIILLLFTLSNINAAIKTGAEQTEKYLNLLQGKRVALVVNQTSTIGKTHLLDTLIASGIDVQCVFAPEHGFRGDADAGESIKDGKDIKSGINIFSLYGETKKPSKEQLANIDIVIFDIQDVGARFYTYISTMHYVMEACAENNKELIILDRPNPNDVVDGPVLKNAELKSFVGMHPIPILHGCTVGELAMMINGEGWLANAAKCKLQVITIQNWRHGDEYILPIPPSPNLPNQFAVNMYPSLCWFEATNVSVGRGTDFPFQVIGIPDNKDKGNFSFTPRSIEGKAKHPLHEGVTCYGKDLRTEEQFIGIQLKYLLMFYHDCNRKQEFFTSTNFFDKLAGTEKLRTQLAKGWCPVDIRDSWTKDIYHYKKIRKDYLLYDDYPTIFSKR